MKGKKYGGRRKGTPNKLTASIKQAFIDAFQELGGVPALVRWGEDNPTEFYKLASRLIPTEVAVAAEMAPLVIDLVNAQDLAHADDPDAA